MSGFEQFWPLKVRSRLLTPERRMCRIPGFYRVFKAILLPFTLRISWLFCIS